jgi:hypothetical protein
LSILNLHQRFLRGSRVRKYWTEGYLDQQGGGEKKTFLWENPEKEKEESILLFFLKFPYKKGENRSLRKLRKPGEREKKVVLRFSSTLLINSLALKSLDFVAPYEWMNKGGFLKNIAWVNVSFGEGWKHAINVLSAR